MSNKSGGTFGAPKPLPGQAGYGVTVTDTLKKDASEMEARLQALQERMRQQQRESEAQAKAGSSAKWKSARAEKGSVTRYQKEVQDKHKKRHETEGGGDPALRTAPRASGTHRTARQAAVAAAADSDFRSRDVDSWAVADVSEWLRAVALPQYVSSFAQNEISGGILLDVTLEDLDYMQITVLAHRKILLRGVEDLRRAGRFTEAPLSLSPQKGPGLLRTLSNPTLGDDARSILSQSQPAMHFSEQTQAQYVPQAQPYESKGTHWSHLEPLSNNKVAGGSAMANAADDDVMDEAAERKAFQQAVAEWRREDEQAAAAGLPKQPLRIEREYQKAPAGEPGNMWTNPFGAPAADPEMLDEAAERRAFQQAVAEWRGSGSTGAGSDPPANPPTRTIPPGRKSTTGTTTHGQTLDNSDNEADSEGPASSPLDEQKEHAEFVKAVDAWRNRDAPTGKASSGAGATLAQQLARELESEGEASSLRLRLQKEEAKRNLQQANLELERLRLVRLSAAAPIEEGGSDAEEEEREEEKGGAFVYSAQPAYRRNPTESDSPREPLSIHTVQEVIQTIVSPGTYSASPDRPAQGSPSYVAVSLVTSVLGTQGQGEGKGEEELDDYLVVEVDTDED
ncbi:hypothetical protein B484DRAFT_444780 [Ochromonadaceae sp. CCMP2298]|nr:hypothetical protein B484DRAFT_444780 [Ochromonadaceae sp. CCMP2298]